MVDPTDVINYKRTGYELEEFLIFCIMVAGKTAKTIAPKVDSLLSLFRREGELPLDTLRRLDEEDGLLEALLTVKTGAYTKLIKAFKYLAQRPLDLRSCSLEDLEGVPGIGPKTSRYFLLYTRPNQWIAVLDTHILRYLKSLGYDVPKSTPSTTMLYKRIERYFLDEAEKSGKDLAQFDLDIWNSLARSGTNALRQK